MASTPASHASFTGPRAYGRSYAYPTWRFS
jgi:hypothetical protein